MQELSLNSAIFYGMRELRQQGLMFDPHLQALVNDFQSLSSNYSGAIVIPVAKDRFNNGYEVVKVTTPDIKAPDITFEILWECTKEHYGLTVASGLAIYGSIPINKVNLGHWVQRGSSETTNIISHYGLKFFPKARLPADSTAARLAKATFGTIRIFGIVGRALPFAAVGLAAFDVVSIGMCAYEARNGK